MRDMARELLAARSAVIIGREPNLASKKHPKMFWVRISDTHSNFKDAYIRSAQHLFGPVDPALNDVLVRADPSGFFPSDGRMTCGRQCRNWGVMEDCSNMICAGLRCDSGMSTLSSSRVTMARQNSTRSTHDEVLSALVVDWSHGRRVQPVEDGMSSFAGLSRAQLIFALAGVMLTLLTSAMDQAISTSAMPRAIASLNGFARYSWPATSFALTSAIAIPVFAKLSDLYGRKRLYLFCAAFFVAALLVCGTAGTLPIPLDGMNQLVVARGFAGLANGGIIAISYTLIADLFPPSERGRYQGAPWGRLGNRLVRGTKLWRLDHRSRFLALGILC
jgi:hypothetical protein